MDGIISGGALTLDFTVKNTNWPYCPDQVKYHLRNSATDLTLSLKEMLNLAVLYFGTNSRIHSLRWSSCVSFQLSWMVKISRPVIVWRLGIDFLALSPPTGGHFARACVNPLNDNSVGASNLMARNRKLARKVTVLLKAILLVLAYNAVSSKNKYFC